MYTREPDTRAEQREPHATAAGGGRSTDPLIYFPQMFALELCFAIFALLCVESYAIRLVIRLIRRMGKQIRSRIFCFSLRLRCAKKTFVLPLPREFRDRNQSRHFDRKGHDVGRLNGLYGNCLPPMGRCLTNNSPSNSKAMTISYFFSCASPPIIFHCSTLPATAHSGLPSREIENERSMPSCANFLILHTSDRMHG